MKRAHRIADQLRAGTVWVDCYNIVDASMPFGGYKQSGWEREMAGAVLKNFLETKSVYERLARNGRARLRGRARTCSGRAK